MSVTKAVVPAAGLGTRMLPAAKAVPKELLPVLDRPAIQYVVEEAAEAGIREVVLITSRGKGAIEGHFRANQELEARLKSSGKQELLASIQQLMAKVRISSVDQPQQRGLGDAVAQARESVGGQTFLCLLGDTIFSGDALPSRQLIDAHRELGGAIIGVEEVPAEKVSRYGIVGGKQIRADVLRLDTIVEKPSPQDAPSRLAVAARYLLTPAIFACLDETKPGKGGEIQLTDAINLLIAREPVHAIVLRSARHDIGSPLDWLKANLTMASRDAKLWEQIAPLVNQLMKK